MRYAPLRHGNLFVSNLPEATDVAHFKRFFAYWGCHGIDKVSFNPRKRTALVKFQSIWDAQRAMQRMNHRRYGRTATEARRMSVRPAKNDYMPRQPGLELPSSRLYVTRRTHGPKEVMAQSDLEAWFSSCGDVQEMKVLKCKEHQARGIIKMASVHQATYAMKQLNGHPPPGQPGHDARPLVVKFAYHKIAKNKPDTFLSNSQQATKWEGTGTGNKGEGHRHGKQREPMGGHGQWETKGEGMGNGKQRGRARERETKGAVSTPPKRSWVVSGGDVALVAEKRSHEITYRKDVWSFCDVRGASPRLRYFMAGP